MAPTTTINPGDTVEVVVQRWLAQEQKLQSRHLSGIVKSVKDRAIELEGTGVVREADACHRCHLPIDHVASRLIGYGPDCSEKLGIDWIRKAESLTPEQIAAVRESVAVATKGTWWLPLRGLEIAKHEATGTPLTAEEKKAISGKKATIKGERTEFVFPWGCESFDAIKNAIKVAGGRWNPVSKLWDVRTDRAKEVAEAWDFTVIGEWPADSSAASNAGRIIEVDGAAYVISWDRGDRQFSEILEAVKSIVGRRYNPTTFKWSIPGTSIAHLKSVATRFSFVWTEAAQQEDAKQAEQRAREVESARERLAAAEEARQERQRQLDEENRQRREQARLEAEQKAEEARARAALVAASRQAESDYELGFALPEGLAPRPYQLAYVEYAEAVGGRLIDADEMGLGKTVESMLANHKFDGYPLLVVAPAAVLLNWKREFNRFLPQLKVEVCHGRDLSPRKADVYVINYESLSVGQVKEGNRRRIVLSQTAQRLRKRGLKGIIVDEAHYCKNASASRTKAVVAVREGTEVRQVLSGTPIPNHTGEIEAQIEIVGLWDKFPGGQKGFKKLVKDKEFDQINEHLRSIGYIRRLKTQVMTHLPEKTYSNQWVEDWESGQDYGAAYDDLVEAYEQHNTANQLAALVKMRVAVGLRKIGPAVQFASEHLNETSEKLVITAYHKTVQEEIYNALCARFPHLKIARFAASDKMEIRQANIDAFQTDPECRVIVISLKAGGIGITLTAAHDLLHVEQDWVPANMDQASDRVHRDGQTQAVIINELLADASIDSILKNVQARKLPEIIASTTGKVGDMPVETAVIKAVIQELVSQYRKARVEVAA